MNIIKKMTFSKKLVLFSITFFSFMLILWFSITNYFLYKKTKDFLVSQVRISGKAFLANYETDLLISPDKVLINKFKSFCNNNNISGISLIMNSGNSISFPQNACYMKNPIVLPILESGDKEPFQLYFSNSSLQGTKSIGKLMIYPDYTSLSKEFYSLIKSTIILLLIFIFFGALSIMKIIRSTINQYLKRFSTLLEKSVFSNSEELPGDEFDSILMEFQKKASELENTRAQLLKQEKLSSLVTLTSGMAHEINNFLTPALGYSSLIEMNNSFNNEEKEYIEIIQSSLSSAKEVVKSMLSLSGNTMNAKIERCSLNFLIKRFLKTFCYDYRHNNKECPIDFISPDKDIICEINPGHFNQILFNLIKNCLQAYPDDSTYNKVEVELNEDKENCVLIISDKACGMSDETKKHIFDPFFTTKSSSKGTGLGMSIVYSIIKSYNGDIKVDSALNIGTTFTITIPKNTGNLLTPIEDDKEDYLPNQQGIILVIEDSKEIQEMIEDFLSDTKIKIIKALNFKEAKKALSSPDLRLILCDLKLPYLPGIKVYLKIIRDYPNLKGIFSIMSATVSEKEKAVINEENIPYLQKPFDYKEFRSFITSILKKAD